ncbi:MAG: hypothetical protein A2142_01220 [candidate division Zixibacteria bacterium RBG_16_48_11]|nr:MAG: hypothetical protein A2142_01220 [candidate division Zixibacteria bacterium RBG_16_48_11]
MFERPTLLVLDRDYLSLQTIQETLAVEQFQLFLCTESKAAQQVLSRRKVDLVLADLLVGKEVSLEILRQAKQAQPETVIILMTSPQPTLKSAVEILREGVYDYLIKPFDSTSLLNTIQRAYAELRLRKENTLLKELVSLHQIGESAGTAMDMKKVLGQILEATLKGLESDLATILLWDEDHSRFRLFESRERNQLSFQNWEFDSTGPTVVYLKPQIISEPEEIVRVFPPAKHYRIESLLTYPLFAKDRILGILYLARHDSAHPFTNSEVQSLAILATKASAALENSRLYRQLEQAYLSTINALANAVEARDVYTKGHTERVWYLAQTLARKLGWSEEQLAQVRMGSILHDIGKIGVPDSILNKPASLTAEEFEIMKRHPQMGVKMLEGIKFLEPALPYVLYHHERYDGKGYPVGLSGEWIPIEGRLMAVVDTFDAITSDRPYRKNLGYQKAIQELTDFSGTQFDPQIAKALVQAWLKGEIDQSRLEVKSLLQKSMIAQSSLVLT